MSFVPAFGRIEDSEHTEKLIAAQVTPYASQAMQWEGDDNSTIFLPGIYTKITGQPWDSMNQNPRGICVSMGWAKAATLTLAVMAHLGKITFPGRVHPGPIYGGARYEIGYEKYGNRISGDDGAVGSWAGEWLQDRGGVLLFQKYDNVDLTRFDPNDVADNYGRRGVPDQIEDDAKLHPAKQLTLCKNSSDVLSMISQLYSVTVCSNQGFSMSRDSKGFCRPGGSWAHCMHWVGRIKINGVWYLILDNSWEGRPDGSGYLGGTMTLTGDDGVTVQLTGNMFLVSLDTCDRMCAARETIAISPSIDGFSKQRELFLI